LNGMALVRIVVGAVWLNGGVEKLLNPDFPQQFAQSLEVGAFVSQAPTFFQNFMQSTVVPNAETVAQLVRIGELSLGVTLILGLLTNLAAIGSVFLSLNIMLSQGSPNLGEGLGAPGIFTLNAVLILLSLIILFSKDAKDFALDSPIANRRPRLAPILTNRRSRRRY
jgi:thiosulfate dehydrogenase (quinone) large subunit